MHRPSELYRASDRLAPNDPHAWPTESSAAGRGNLRNVLTEVAQAGSTFDSLAWQLPERSWTPVPGMFLFFVVVFSFADTVPSAAPTH
jgi:hypothetical protein